MRTTPPPTGKDYELADLARRRLDQIGEPPKAEELAAVNRILVQQARGRLLEQQASAAATRSLVF